MVDIIKNAEKLLEEEAKAILDLRKTLGKNFVDSVNMLFKCKGKVVLTGIGKSGIIGRKIAATLASTGTPSFFMHSAEALHGDVGMINKEDVVIAISHSGESDELIALLPAIKRIGAKLIAITSNKKSRLARYSDIVLDLGVKEANSFVPTTSSIAALAIGDAMAICLLKKKNFKPEDFALLHPAGRLGKRLLLKVDDVMHKGKENPIVQENDLMKKAIIEITSKRLGAVSVVDDKGILVGIITDGDLRRALEKYGGELMEKKVFEIMTKNPITIKSGKLGTEAVRLMEDRPSQIMVLPVIDENNKPIGMVRIHDLVKAGIV